jgi:hypothetical protein
MSTRRDDVSDEEKRTDEEAEVEAHARPSSFGRPGSFTANEEPAAEGEESDEVEAHAMKFTAPKRQL